MWEEIPIYRVNVESPTQLPKELERVNINDEEDQEVGRELCGVDGYILTSVCNVQEFTIREFLTCWCFP